MTLTLNPRRTGHDPYKVKCRLVQKIKRTDGQKDTTDCSTFPADVVAKKSAECAGEFDCSSEVQQSHLESVTTLTNGSPTQYAVQPINTLTYRPIGRYRRTKHKKPMTFLNVTRHLLCIYFPLRTAHCLCKRNYGLG